MSENLTMSENLNNMETFFMALADRTRLRLLNLMDDEVCVCFFTEILREPQPKISRHLAYLRRAGIVEARRDGKWMHYRIVEPKNSAAARVLQEVRKWMANDEKMQEERRRFEQVCRTPQQLPVTLQRAPRPHNFEKPNMSFEKNRQREEKRELEEFLL